MTKDIISLGFEIPGFSNLEKQFSASISLMDADIVIISPEIIEPKGNWISFSSGGSGYYDISTSKKFLQKTEHLKKELVDFLKLGKIIFLFLDEMKNFPLALSVTHPRKGENLYQTTTASNYDFLPINIGKITSASGEKIQFIGNSLFNNFNKNFNNNLSYKAYLENVEQGQIIYSGKDKSKTLGSIHKIGNGHLITLPYLKYDKNFIEYNEEEDENVWTKPAVTFGNNLTKCFTDIDENISLTVNKTPTPEWANQSEFLSNKVKLIEKSIDNNNNNNQKIEELKNNNFVLQEELLEEFKVKDLLFETGNALENAITEALIILGYEAENFNNGVLELDQVIISPEKQRFIGECEGKDSKDINITKFRQLLESLNADFAREDVEEKAYGILFGNPQRLIEPQNRTLDFTEKCKICAEREKITLIKTSDLFPIVKYLREKKNEAFKKNVEKQYLEDLEKL